MTAQLAPGYDADLINVADLLDNADPWWRSGAQRALDVLISTGYPFTTDDLRDLGVEDIDNPAEQRARWGSLIASAKAAGRIVEVGRRPSRRPSANGRKVSVWQGVPSEAVAS